MSLRQIAALRLPDVEPAQIETAPPEVRIVDPAMLSVDADYQRALSERSVRLIRKIVGEWDWRAFKPPVVVEIDDRLEVIDGQHTAIAAVTHGGLGHIPVLVIEGAAREDRASAFVRHNRDRVAVTPLQIYTALLAAGDEDALTIAQVCERAGVRILQMPPANGHYAPGDTMAISTLRALVNRRHAMGGRIVLETCVKTGFQLTADLIKAVEHLLFAAEYKDDIDAERVALVMSAHGSTLMGEAKRFAAERKLPLWRALASVTFMKRRKPRGG